MQHIPMYDSLSKTQKCFVILMFFVQERVVRYTVTLSRPLSISVLMSANAEVSFGISDPDNNGQLENIGSPEPNFMLII